MEKAKKLVNISLTEEEYNAFTDVMTGSIRIPGYFDYLRGFKRSTLDLAGDAIAKFADAGERLRDS